MKLELHTAGLAVLLALAACSGPRGGETRTAPPGTRLYFDEHHLDPKDVTLHGVAEAHAKDLAVEGAHGVDYERYWVDAKTGTIYCLVRAPSARAAEDVHRLAHGLVADDIREVEPGILPARASGGKRLFLDTHEVGPGVRAADVAEAHKKDLAVQGAHGVRFLEYWVDEKGGRIHCLVEAPDESAVVETHRAAHGLLPEAVHEVVAGG
ncbi:MAG: DUF4242 domain-containing protein [Planctomycetota bacterium]